MYALGVDPVIVCAIGELVCGFQEAIFTRLISIIPLTIIPFGPASFSYSKLPSPIPPLLSPIPTPTLEELEVI